MSTDVCESRPSRQGASVSNRRSFLVFLTACSLYLFTSSGYIALADANTMLGVTRSLLTHHQVYVDASLGVPGVGYHYYSIYGIGWSGAVLPLYLLGMILEHRVHVVDQGGLPMFFASLLNPALMAVAVSLVYAFVVHLTQSLRAGLAVAGAFALATPAWPFTKEGFSEPLVLTCLLGGVYLLRHGIVLSPARAIFGGMLLGLAILTRLDAGPEVVVALCYGLAPADRRKRLGSCSLLLLSVLTVGSLYLAYDQLRFGSVFRTGYEYLGYGTSFHRSLLDAGTALVDEVIDPTRGLLWFVPTTVVSVAAFPGFLRRWRSEAILTLCMFLVAGIEHANIFISWEAGWTWGPRFLVPILPFLCLPLSVAASSRQWRPWLAFFSIVGFAMNVPAVLVTYTRYFYASAADPGTGPWPSLFLSRAVIHIGRLVVTQQVPKGRITELASQGPAAIVNGATSLNSPDFWWFFLLQEHSHVLAVAIVAGALFFAFWTFGLLTYRMSS